VATVSGDHVARVWSASSGREILALKGHAAIVRFIAFSPDSRFITTASEDGAVKLWRAELGRESFKSDLVVEGMDFSPDGKRLAVAQDDHRATVWDIESGRQALVLQGHLHRVNKIAFSRDGKRIATSSFDKTARVWDAETGRIEFTLRGHSYLMYGIAFSPDGRYVASCGDGIRIWDLAAPELPRTLWMNTNFNVMAIAFRPVGSQLATGSRDGSVSLWNPETGERVRRLDGHTERVMALAYSPDGRMLATAGFDRTIQLWDPTSGKLVRTLRGHLKIYAADFSPHGRRLVTATAEHGWNAGRPTAQVWDVETGRELMVLDDHTSPVSFALFSPDGRRIATSDWSGTVRVWETFPWREDEYPGNPRQPLARRAALFGEDYWRRRMTVDAWTSNASNGRRPARQRIDRSEFPSRATNASPNLLDLTEHYNALLNVSWIPNTWQHLVASDLSTMPSGLVQFGNTLFDVRGVIQLRAPSNAWLELPSATTPLPERTEGIRIGRKFARLHALLGTMGKEPDDTPIGAFVFHYANGRQHEIAIRYGQYLRDWWSGGDANESIREGALVWRGNNHLTRVLDGDIRIFASRFENPHPDQAIERIDFVSKLTGSGPFLIALTIEP
jgi:WD40 repeat protein